MQDRVVSRHYNYFVLPHSSFISYTMAVIAVNFVVPLSVMFYCYYNVSVTVKRYKASNCLDSINIDWSDQMDVTKVKTELSQYETHSSFIYFCHMLTGSFSESHHLSEWLKSFYIRNPALFRELATI